MRASRATCRSMPRARRLPSSRSPRALGLSVEQLARGSMVIASAMMAGTIKTITLERGVDARESSLMMFGGAGGLFATLLASELGVRRVIVPPHPGNFSALGLLGADLVRSHARTRLLQLDDDGLAEASRTLQELFASFDGRAADGRRRPRSTCATPARSTR